MPLIERFTPGGNMYPDGSSTFAVLVQAFRRMAENRDNRDAATLATAQTDATTKANTAETKAKAHADTKAATAENAAKTYATTVAKNYADTAAGAALTDAKGYTDDTFLATPAGQASDASIDAGVSRAVQGNRIPSNYVRQGERDVNVKDAPYNAKGDGITDDGPAIRAALAAGGGRTIYFPEGVYNYQATGTLVLPAGTTLRGVPGRTILNFGSTLGSHTNLLNNDGDNVTLEGLTVNRVANFPAILINSKNYAGLTIRDCVFNGNRSLYSNYCHGFQVSDSAGVLAGLNVRHSVFRGLNFGYFQNNHSQAVVQDPSFYRCIFEGNYATDLEFNSPVSDTFNVDVSDCLFTNNQSATVTGGFAVGLAHVTKTKIKGNTFEGYNNEPVHVEDWCTRTLIADNFFKRCGLLYAGHIRITSGANDVTISGNDFDATDNNPGASDINVIHSTAGKEDGSLTPGGRAHTHPARIHVAGNTIRAGKCKFMYISHSEDSIIANNIVTGAGKVNGLAYDNANEVYALDVWGGTNVSVTGNVIRGFKYMMPRRTSGTSTGGEGFVLADNVVSDCKYGVSVINPGACVINANMVRNTVHPFIVGQGAGTARPAVITNNYATGCKYPMEIDGRLVVVATADAASGATSITIEPLGMAINATHKFTFPSGAVFTPVAGGASAGATTLTGTLTGGSVQSGDAGQASNLWHSWSGSTNRPSISGNIDTVAGVYGDLSLVSATGTRHRITVSGGTLTATPI